MQNCTFCNINPEKYISQNKECFAIYDINQHAKGHTLIIPKKHRKNFFYLNKSERKSMYKLTLKTLRFLKKKFSPNHLNLIFNCGKAGNQKIFHCHCHIIPRYTDPQINLANSIIQKQKIILRNHQAKLLNAQKPLSKGHLIIATINRNSDIFSLTDNEFDNLDNLLQRGKELLDQDFSPDGYNIVINSGLDILEKINTFSINLIDRYLGDKQEIRNSWAHFFNIG